MNPVYILATGARTPLGLRAAPSAAAVRAGVSVLGHHPTWVDRLGEPMVGALDSQLDPDRAGPDRLMALAESALLELSEALPPSAAARVPLYLALSEFRPGFAKESAAEISKRVGRLNGFSFGIEHVRTFPNGHAAGALALAAAIRSLGSGTEMCIVGGVESYFEADTMRWLDGHRQLAGPDGRSSFVPGEGAGFLLLSNRRLSEHGLNGKATVLRCEVASEQARIKTPMVCLGEGLTAAVQRSVEGLHTARRVSDVFCDLNGERYRAEEWGFVCLRLAKHFEDPLSYRAPANVWGDMGAASIPMFAMLACQAAERGYARGPFSLLWASSEGGDRGAVLMQTRGG